MYATRKTPKPAWVWLYGIVTVMGGLLGVIEVTIPDGPARRVLECMATLAIFGAMALWVRANRVALALDEGDDEAARRPAIAPDRSAGRVTPPAHVAGARQRSFGRVPSYFADPRRPGR